jgi:cytosine/adenosine deaminase-related metal-dependent hydrolase
LSIAEEIRVLQTTQQIPLESLLQMATMNGAKALRWEQDLGSFEKGKIPGIVLLSSDLKSVKRLV